MKMATETKIETKEEQEQEQETRQAAKQNWTVWSDFCMNEKRKILSK